MLPMQSLRSAGRTALRGLQVRRLRKTSGKAHDRDLPVLQHVITSPSSKLHGLARCLIADRTVPPEHL